MKKNLSSGLKITYKTQVNVIISPRRTDPRLYYQSARGVVTALKPVRVEQVRRPEPPVALGFGGITPSPGNFLKSLEIFNAISCDLVHNYLMLQVPI